MKRILIDLGDNQELKITDESGSPVDIGVVREKLKAAKSVNGAALNGTQDVSGDPNIDTKSANEASDAINKAAGGGSEVEAAPEQETASQDSP